MARKTVLVALNIVSCFLARTNTLKILYFNDDPYESNFKENYARLSNPVQKDFQDLALCYRFR